VQKGIPSIYSESAYIALVEDSTCCAFKD